MDSKTKFKNELYSYKKYLEKRFDKGAEYINKNNCFNDKYYDAYVDIMWELAHIQSLINHYERRD